MKKPTKTPVPAASRRSTPAFAAAAPVPAVAKADPRAAASKSDRALRREALSMALSLAETTNAAGIVEAAREFETYLKGFRPVAPAPLSRRTMRSAWRSSVATAVAAAIAALLLIVPPNPPPASESSQPMTLDTAEALLAAARPWNDTLNSEGFAVAPANQTKPQGISALALLSKQDLPR